MNICYNFLKTLYVKKVIIFSFFLFLSSCTSSGEIISKYNNSKKNDTLVMHFYNGLDSENYNTIEISKYFLSNAPLKYSLKLWYNTQYPLNIQKIFIEADKNRTELKDKVFSYQKKRDGVITEMHFYKLEQEQVNMICGNNDIIIKLQGVSNSVDIMFMESHYSLVDEFCDQVVSR